MSAFCALPRRAGGVRQAVAAAPWRRCSCHDMQLPRRGQHGGRGSRAPAGDPARAPREAHARARPRQQPGGRGGRQQLRRLDERLAAGGAPRVEQRAQHGLRERAAGRQRGHVHADQPEAPAHQARPGRQVRRQRLRPRPGRVSPRPLASRSTARQQGRCGAPGRQAARVPGQAWRASPGYVRRVRWNVSSSEPTQRKSSRPATVTPSSTACTCCGSVVVTDACGTPAASRPRDTPAR